MWKANANEMDFVNDAAPPSSAGFLAEDATSGQAGGNKSEGRESKTIIAVTTNQLHKLITSNGMVMEQQKISLVRFVGRLISVSEQSTKAIYIVSDGTGAPVEVRSWKVAENNPHKPAPSGEEILMENSYVRVIGQPRRHESASGAYVVAFSVAPIESFNEYTVHLLEVMDHAKYLKEQKNMFLHSGKRDFDVTGGHSRSVMSVGGQSDSKLGTVSGLNDIQQAILKIVVDNSHRDKGIPRNEIINSLQAVPASTIVKELSFLSSEGHIFTVFNDDQYKATDY